MRFSRLLAKSSDSEDSPEPEETLAGHTRFVMEAADFFYEALADELKKFIGSDFISGFFRSALLAAAWLHDIGKANNHFQEMIRKPGVRQGVRHETFALVVIDECLKRLLEPLWSSNPSWYKSAILFAVSGHHLKFPDDPGKINRPTRDVEFMGGHPDLSRYWELGVQRLNIPPWETGQNVGFSLMPFGGLTEKLRELHHRLDDDFCVEQKLFIAALKSTLMASDLAGSALPQRNLSLAAWLSRRLGTVLRGDQLEKLIHRRVPRYKLRSFQGSLGRSDAHTVLVEAGCGSGKTIGAYLWCARKGDGRRLFFSYPTTGTAAEGFIGYMQDPEFEALLVNSRSEMDYRLLEDMPAENNTQKELRLLKLEALETWPVPVVVCTAHTVLGLMQNVRRSVYTWPSILRSVFVFDEVHAYSPKLFGHLLRFLSVFRSHPVLLMTATLPSKRKLALQRVCGTRGGLEIFVGPKEREESKRYTLEKASEDDAWCETAGVLSQGGKVLWVSNTVDRAIERTRRAQEAGFPVEPYHSRYRYRDRVFRHRRVVDGFKPNQQALVAMTTQVAEMSLDLSADLLVTEYAPVPALIQRLGRLNRFEDAPTKIGKAVLIQPENHYPYVADKSEEHHFWASIEDWLSKIADGSPKSQRELGRAFAELASDDDAGDEEELFCDWLDEPWSSLRNRHSIVEAGHTVELIREEDLHEGSLQENAIPMPFPKDKSWYRWPQKGRYLIAPEGTIEYDPFWGGRYAGEKSFFRII
ncbi:MAG: CRISPR-associated helicase Cas3' [Syntrophobacteraceae bacterium]